MNLYTPIDVNQVLDKLIQTFVDQIGTQLDTWDKPRTYKEHVEFMKVESHDLIIPDLNG